MRELRKWAWTAVIAVAAASPVAAQQGTVVSGGGRTTGSLSGTGGQYGGGAGQLGGGGGGSGGGLGGGGSGQGSQLQGTALQTMTAPPKISPPTGQNSSSLAASNVFAGYYGNPYFQGLITAQTNATPGGFGAPLYGTSSGGGRGSTGTSGQYSGIGAGRGGAQSNQQSGILIPIPVQIAYTAKMQFPTPPVATSKMQADLRQMIDGTNQIANSKNVQIVIDEHNNVALRGTVKDDDEARLIEGLVRLTPGVGRIHNELTFNPTASTTASAGK